MARVVPDKTVPIEINSPASSKVAPDFYCLVLVQNIIGSLLCCWSLGLVGIFLLIKSEHGSEKGNLHRANYIGLSSILGGFIVTGTMALLLLLTIFWIIPE